MKDSQNKKNTERRARFWWWRGKETGSTHVAVISGEGVLPEPEQLRTEGGSLDRLVFSAGTEQEPFFTDWTKEFLRDYRYPLVLAIWEGALPEAWSKGLEAVSARCEVRVIRKEPAKDGWQTVPREADLVAQVLRLAEEAQRGKKEFPADSGAVEETFIREKREEIEWLNLRVQKPEGLSGNKRVLVIGDSISNGYGRFLAEFAGDRILDSMQSSRGADDPALLREIRLMCQENRYDEITLNVGLHDHGLTPSEYARRMSGLVEALASLSPGAKRFGISTTDISSERNGILVHDPEKSRYVEEINREWEEICRREGMPYLDLYTEEVAEHYPKIDSVHYEDVAYRRFAQRIGAFLQEKNG